MPVIYNKNKKMNAVLLLFVTILFPAISQGQLNSQAELRFNVLTSQPYQAECSGKSCRYRRLHVQADELADLVRNVLDPNETGTFFSVNFLSDTRVLVSQSDDQVIEFSSIDPKNSYRVAQCPDPNDMSDNPEKFSCLDVIEYLLIHFDKPKTVRLTDQFLVKFVFYEYNISAAKNFNFGFGGFSGSENGVDIPSRLELNNPAPSQSLVLNAGNRLSDLLSLRLTLGHLGGYIESSFSIDVNMSNGQSVFKSQYGTSQVYLNVSQVSGTPSSEQIGFSFTGTIEKVKSDDGQDLIEFTDFDFYYATPRERPEGDSTIGISLVDVINPSPNGGSNFYLAPGKPYQLFEMSAAEFGRIKNTALNGIDRNSQSQSSNIIGVLYVEEVYQGTSLRKTSKYDASPYQFYDLLNNAQLSFDPRLMRAIPINSQVSKKPKSEPISFSEKAGEYSMASYLIKLDEKYLEPGMEDQAFEVSIVDSPVVMTNGKGSQKVRIGQLVKEGFRFGVKSKGEKIDVSALKFKVKLSLPRSFYETENEWTDMSWVERDANGKITKGPTNMFIYEITHDLTTGNGLFKVKGKPFLEFF